MFVIAINNIADNLDASSFKSLYVDDLTIFMAHEDADEIERKMQNAIDAVARNAEACGFTFSRDKSKGVYFCRLRKDHNHPPLKMNGLALEYVTSIKYLGLTFDSKLRWQPHVHNTLFQPSRS